jgi:hypothetical protein
MNPPREQSDCAVTIRLMILGMTIRASEPSLGVMRTWISPVYPRRPEVETAAPLAAIEAQPTAAQERLMCTQVIGRWAGSRQT